MVSTWTDWVSWVGNTSPAGHEHLRLRCGPKDGKDWEGLKVGEQMMTAKLVIHQDMTWKHMSNLDSKEVDCFACFYDWVVWIPKVLLLHDTMNKTPAQTFPPLCGFSLLGIAQQISQVTCGCVIRFQEVLGQLRRWKGKSAAPWKDTKETKIDGEFSNVLLI